MASEVLIIIPYIKRNYYQNSTFVKVGSCQNQGFLQEPQSVELPGGTKIHK